MNCHNDQSNQSNHEGHKRKVHKGHMLMMLVCCGAPFLVFLLIPLLGSRLNLGTWTALPFLSSLICPVMMVIMMVVMMRGQNKNSVPDTQQSDLGSDRDV